MKEKRNYWLFRVSEKWGSKIPTCFEENLVYAGWNCGLSYRKKEDILEEYPWASKMAIKFTYIKEGDIIIMPNYDGIAIGIAKDKQHRPDLEWQDTINVNWLTKFYPRKHLTSAFQTSLKYRGTFMNLFRYGNEIETLIDNGFEPLEETYKSKIQDEKKANIEKLAKHINSRSDTYFQDIEFENFILELFTLKYNGFIGVNNSQQQEAIDGKDLYLSYAIDELDILIELNIQVKQHTNNASLGGIFQINKSKINKEDNNIVARNILVTSGNLTDEFINRAKEENVYVYGPKDIAEMILENYIDLDQNYLSKLGIYNQLSILN